MNPNPTEPKHPGCKSVMVSDKFIGHVNGVDVYEGTQSDDYLFVWGDLPGEADSETVSHLGSSFLADREQTAPAVLFCIAHRKLNS